MSTWHYEFPVGSESKRDREFAPKELDRLPGSSTLIKSDADLCRLQEVQGHGVETMLRRCTSTRGY
jgi:hypothetical protein